MLRSRTCDLGSVRGQGVRGQTAPFPADSSSVFFEHEELVNWVLHQVAAGVDG